ncbi:two-component system, OmpR family, sensor histidine kinase BaeS [Azotobacter beijerinckii]|uniref:histidine kinase n=1 Tax=Azotobacter beijerinckii TaxID=170623 RepID=A0A1H9IQN8_9GAMM|nr:two-component system, OmpR family, sensor histidine kinase BaeS [Azotobacter beijerinckii]
MKISLSTKVFLTVQALCSFAVLGMALAAYLSFAHGFLGYLNEQAIERLERILPNFQRAYAEHGDWRFLDGNPDEWFFLTRPDDRPKGASSGLPPPPISDLTGAFLRLTLLDAGQDYVAGYSQYASQPVLRAVRVDGETVGWLAMTPFETVSAAGDQRFQAGQIRSSIAIALICLLLSAVIGWWIARSLLRPIRRVARATRQLAAGDYSIEVPVSSNDEAGQLAGAFNRMARTLAANERMRREFMTDISHELRTPLAVMRGELEAMEDGIRPTDPAALRSLQAEVAALSKLVDDLFELSLADVGGPTYRHEPLDLRLLLESLADSYRSRFAERGLALELQLPDGPLSVEGDEMRLNQLFHNLLENSLRYTEPGGRVRLGGQRQGGEAILVHCEDSGPGCSSASTGSRGRAVAAAAAPAWDWRSAAASPKPMAAACRPKPRRWAACG